MSLPLFDPMLATGWPAPFDDDEWWFEVKWDGYRAVVANDGGRITARSRRGLDMLDPFPELRALSIPEGVVLDGEIVALDEQGRPSFSMLQRRTGFGGRGTAARVGVSLVLFDVLHAQGMDLIEEPLEERRRRLTELELSSPLVVPDPTPRDGRALFDAVSGRGIEGIVAKRRGSRYLPGRRSPDWRKISVRQRLRAVVGGYTPGTGGRSDTFGSLLMGLFTGVGLRYIGSVGSGFDDAELTAFKSALTDLETATPPFIGEVAVAGPRWVEPGIVISVEYKEWTHDHHLRAPVYKGIEMADPETVTWRVEGPTVERGSS